MVIDSRLSFRCLRGLSDGKSPFHALETYHWFPSLPHNVMRVHLLAVPGAPTFRCRGIYGGKQRMLA